MDLTDQSYWAGAFANQEDVDRLPIFDRVASHLRRVPGLTFFEVGCAPGDILARFCAQFGYEAHGVDFAYEPEVIERRLRERGVRIGRIEQTDFRLFRPGRRYDIVASFGFVEHFDDAEVMVDRHFELVEPGGTVAIAFPNFRRLQGVLHYVLDRENLRRHNTSIMTPEFLSAAARRNRAEVVEVGFVGGHCDFWYEPQKRWLPTHIMARATREVLHRLGRGPLARGANSWLSPYLLGVFRAPPRPVEVAAAPVRVGGGGLRAEGS